jgi:flavin-dependent dehydrogenase
VERNDGHWTVQFRDASGTGTTLQSRIIVGADGIGSLVARSGGLAAPPAGPKRFALGGHYRGFGALDDSIEMYVRGKAYFAINPLGAGLANVMVIVNENDLHAWRDDVESHLRDAARDLAGGRRNVDDVQRAGNRVAVGPLEHRVRAAAKPGLYLIGDAAGFVDPFTGQGVFLALRTASLASKAILAELRGERNAYAAYARAHARLIRARKRIARLAGLLVQHPVLARLAAAALTRSAPLRRRLMQAVAGA